MCHGKGSSLGRHECLLLIFAAVFLSSGSCQNAEPRGSFASEGSLRDPNQSRDDPQEGTVDQPFNPVRWDVSQEDGRSPDERVDLAPAISPLSDTGVETKTEAAPARSNGSNKNNAASELKDRDAQSTRKSMFTAVSYRCNSARGSKRRLCVGESRLKKRRRYSNGVRGAFGEQGPSVSNKIRGSSSRSRRIQERGQTRAKNRGRKRNGKRTRQQDSAGKLRSRKNKSGRINEEPPAALRQASNGKVNSSMDTAEALGSKESPTNETLVHLESNPEEDAALRRAPETENTIPPGTTDKPAAPRRRHEDNVEHEFSKNLEKEILWSRTERPVVVEENNSTSPRGSQEVKKPEMKFATAGDAAMNARFDAAKMLGYSRSAEDLPIMDLENEVLARTLEDYNAYLKSSGKVAKSLLRAEGWPAGERNSPAHQRDVPIPVRPLRREQLPGEADQRKDQRQESEELADPETTGLKGDLTCINGTFLPAPLSRHALIKYVKSSIPGHEYLEADYECTPGYYMASSSSRLLCKDRRWVGELPNCRIRRGQSGPCAGSSCDQVCKEVDGQAKCSCYKGFRLDGHKCIDINECDSGNGGCEHKCVNTAGAYRCECPQGMKRGDDKFSCIDVDECYVPDLQTEICRYGCINTPGSYRCVDPTELGDQPVRDSLSITCFTGYELSTDSNCVDINECAINNGGCSEVCENTDGSFFCACDGDEKALSSDGKSCTDINNLACPPLDPARRGYLMCSREAVPRLWRGARKAANRPGTKCYLKCPLGYQLHGEYELTCQGDGTWDGPKHGECVKYSKPRLECPKDVVAEVPPDRDEAFVNFDQPSTDLDWFRYVRSKPSWGTRLEASLKPGLHLVTFFARHPVSKKQASCVLRIIVKEGEAPKVNNCPSDIAGKNGTSFDWIEPTFTDNVRVTHISKNERPGKAFGVGEWKIMYEASDEAGWTTRCVFSVVVHQD